MKRSKGPRSALAATAFICFSFVGESSAVLLGSSSSNPASDVRALNLRRAGEVNGAGALHNPVAEKWRTVALGLKECPPGLPKVGMCKEIRQHLLDLQEKGTFGDDFAGNAMASVETRMAELSDAVLRTT